MVSRHWKGTAKSGEAENYIAHLRIDAFPKLSTVPGFISASILKGELDRGTAFLIMTRWESLGAIDQFAGSAVETAVVSESAQAMMIRYDEKVLHYEAVED